MNCQYKPFSSVIRFILLNYSIALKATINDGPDVDDGFIAYCALRMCHPGFAPIVVDDECICSQYQVVPVVEKRQEFEVEKRQEFEEDEAHICAVRVCPPRFGGVITNGTCGCVQLVGLRPTPTVSTVQSTEAPTVPHVKRQEIAEEAPVAIRQEFVEDEDIICAVRVCPPRFGAIIIDGVCTCTRFGLPPPTPSPVKRSVTAYGDCETPCESGYTGKLFGEYCRCVPPISNDDIFTNTITERQEVDNCFARTCPPRYYSAPDGKGGCDCVQGTKFAPPTA